MAEAPERERLSAEEQAGWDQLVGILDRIPPSLMESVGAGPEDWTVKDVLFHLAAWTDEAAAQLASIRAGRYLDPQIDTDARNREILRAGRGLDPAAARVRLERARARALARWAVLPELSAPAVEWFGEAGPEHYAEHLGELRAFADRVGADDRPGAATRRAGMLAAEREAWTDIDSVIASIPSDGLERPGLTPAGWSAKDTMWHVAMWWEDFLDKVPRFEDPGFDPDDRTYEQVEELNGEQFERSRELPMEEVRERWISAREAAVGAFESMADPSKAAEGWFETNGAVHYEEHLIDLVPWATDARLRGSRG